MARGRLAINYLLEGSELFGGAKVALQQAGAMLRRGHRVTVVSRERPPDWWSVEAEFLTRASLDLADRPPADVTVATYWTTIEPALAAPGGEVVHYCQGFEGAYTHNRQDHPRIEAAYSQPLPAMVVAPHLAELLAQRYGRPARLVPQGLSREWRPAWRRRPRRHPRILVPSPFEIDWKGVRTALEAVKRLRRRGVDCHLVRLSQWPLSREEKALLEPDEFHHRLPPRRVPRLMRSCDLLLAPSWEQEGFGLPVLEAMACGVPAVVSEVSCFRYFATDAACLVPRHEAEAFAAEAQEILQDPALWRQLRRRGRRVARRFSYKRFARASEEALYWVADGRWRRELQELQPASPD